MAIKKKGSSILRESAPLRPMPLSMHIVGGAMYVLREDGVPAQIHDLVAAFGPTHKHRLMGPDGVVEVCIQIGGFRTDAQVTTLQSRDGREVSFITSMTYIRTNAEIGYYMTERGGVFLGFSMVKRERVFTEVYVSQVQRSLSIDHYAYTMTPGPIFLGAGRKPIFLPFEVK